jgi:outer membrane scaffolding protein for murein synthesis (MipA/OmpV family)
MKQFAETYTLDVLHVYVNIENEIKSAKVVTQQLAAKLLCYKNKQLTITQQPVARIKKKPIM